MKKSTRTLRRERRRRRSHGTATLNLTSLMDIFTILVFFLLVNSSNNQKTPDNEDITLPESTAKKPPEEVLTVQISGSDIIIDGQVIANTNDILNNDAKVVPALVNELEARADESKTVVNQEGEAFRKIMILGDRNIPYKVLKKIMLSCNRTDFNRISFAVLRNNEEKG